MNGGISHDEEGGEALGAITAAAEIDDDDDDDGEDTDVLEHHATKVGDDDDDDDDDEDEGAKDALIRGLAQLALNNNNAENGGSKGASVAATAASSQLSPFSSSPIELKGASYRTLIASMLDLTHPIVTANMVEFLLQDGACEVFISFITQIPEEKPAPAAAAAMEPCRHAQKGDVLDEAEEAALARSFNATVLLASDEPTEALMVFLGKKANVITEAIFEVFQPYARGNFHHACRVIDHLLRYYTEQVLHIVGRTKGTIKRYLGPMLRWLAEPSVADILMKFVAVPSVNQLGQFKAQPATKWRVFESLAEWRILVVLAQEVHQPQANLEVTSAAADILIDLIERLSLDENGELLLQPLGHCAEITNGLIERALDKEAPNQQRCDCARVLVAAATRSGEPHVPMNGIQAASFNMGSIALVTNQFLSVRKLYHNRLGQHLPELCESLQNEHTAQASSSSSSDCQVAHPGYIVHVPFSYLRLLLVTLLVEMIEIDEKRLSKIPLPLWRIFCQWFFQYPFSNLYHGLFYRLIYRILKTSHETDQIQQVLLSKCRLVTSLVDSYCKGEASAGNRGHILMLCNAIRLQAGTQPPSWWLRSFLKSHDTWRKFVPRLREATERAYLNTGLGLQIPNQRRFGMMGGELGGFGGEGLIGEAGLGMGLNGEIEMAQDAESIDYGGTLARSLGFVDDVEYIEEVSQANSKKKKKKKHKKQKHGGEDLKAEEEGGGEGEGQEEDDPSTEQQDDP